MPETRQGSFALAVAKWALKAKGNEDKVLRGIVLGLVNELVVRSPVGNPDLWKHPPPPGYVGGRFRANWQVSVGSPASGDLPIIDPTGASTIVRANVTVNGLRCGPDVYIVNNLPYAIPLEYGHSTQAPAGMVRLTGLRYHNIVEREARNIDRINDFAARTGAKRE